MSPGTARRRDANPSSQTSASSRASRSRSNPWSALSARTRQCTTSRSFCRRSSRRKKRPTKPVAPVSRTSRKLLGDTASDGVSRASAAWTTRCSSSTSLWHCGGNRPTRGGTVRSEADGAAIVSGRDSACAKAGSVLVRPDRATRPPWPSRRSLRNTAPAGSGLRAGWRTPKACGERGALRREAHRRSRRLHSRPRTPRRFPFQRRWRAPATGTSPGSQYLCLKLIRIWFGAVSDLSDRAFLTGRHARTGSGHPRSLPLLYQKPVDGRDS